MFLSLQVFHGAKYEINREDVVYLHSVVYLHFRHFCNDMGLAFGLWLSLDTVISTYL